jgi:hypothetical protein
VCICVGGWGSPGKNGEREIMRMYLLGLFCIVSEGPSIGKLDALD